MTNRELWQSVMDQTEKEITSGKYTITFSKYEIYQFPRPSIFKRLRTKIWSLLMAKSERIATKLKLHQIKSGLRQLSRA